MIRLTLLLLYFLVNSAAMNAQDPHFSQFFASPLTLNPAFAGKFDGIVRVAGNYRNQWPTINRAFRTATASIDFPILQKSIAYNDTWGVGVMGYTDKSANGAVSFNYGSVATAFHKGLDEDGYHQLGIGFQLTYAKMLINTTDLKFEDQLTTSGFTGVSSEIFNNANLESQYFDINAGLLYTGSSSDKNNYYVGISGYHLNRPKEEFTGATYSLNRRITLHSGTYFPVSDNTILHLSGLFSTQGGNTETVIGGTFQFTAGTETMEQPVSFYAGSWMRFNDALIPYVGIERGSFRLGVSYDVTTSSLKTASESRGGIELSLIYVNRPSNRRPLPCPKF